MSDTTYPRLSTHRRISGPEEAGDAISMPPGSLEDGTSVIKPSGPLMSPVISRSNASRTPSLLLKSRLPWLDSRPGPRKSSFIKSAERDLLTSSSQTGLLETFEVSQPSRSGSATRKLQLREESTCADDPSRISAVHHELELSGSQHESDNSAQPRDYNIKKSTSAVPIRAVSSGSTQPRIEVLHSLDEKQHNGTPINTLRSVRELPDPVFGAEWTDSLPEIDASPLSNAIRRLEGLMKEAEDLCNDAADTTYAENANSAVETARTGVISASIDVAKVWSPQNRPLLTNTNNSDLSLDERPDTSHPKLPLSVHGRAPQESPDRDFAQRSSLELKRSSSSPHRMERSPTIAFSNIYPIQGENLQDANFNGEAHIAFLSDDLTPSPKTSHARAAASEPMRNRRKSVKILEQRPKQQWYLPRHNTYYNQSWQPDLNPNPKRRKSSVAPVPWNEKTRRRIGHQTRRSKDEGMDEDVENAGSGNDGSNGPKIWRRWRLGHAKSEPIARSWSDFRKRISAFVACANTGIVGYVVGIYAGMVPRIQFQLADQKHEVILGNVVLFIGLAITTLICWPLPLLHGRRGYILASLGLAIPLQFPQAIIVQSFRSPSIFGFEFGLLTCRFITGLLLGLTNINDFATLLDLFGASLQSNHPHQEIVQYDDPRREGGGIGVWLGFWAWCWIGSVSVGFLSGAGIIGSYNPAWGFYITIGLMVMIMIMNVIAPETRHSSLRRTFREPRNMGESHEGRIKRKVARGEVKLHISDEGPKYWFEEVWAGLVLSKRMFFQLGFSVLSLYLGWMYGQNILIIVLLGALLSRSYELPSKYVGLSVLSVSVGALLAVPLTHAGLFSRARKQGPRTDSMTFEPQVTWSSHMVRRIVFMIMLPAMGLFYALVSPGISVHFMIPIVFAGAIGFFDSLAVAECYGLIMESFDTCDLQPGINSRHRLQSLAESLKKRRTNYSSFPRVSAGIFLSQSIGFLCAAAATGVGGALTRDLGAQYSTGITAGILMFLTIALTFALWRFKTVQVIPNHALGTRVITGETNPADDDEFWKPVVIGNPSGKVRRMSLVELGHMSRWTEIRRLNKLL